MNETQWKHRLQYARDHYPPGTRVRLLAMPDDPQPIPPGTTGTVMGVDDAGQLLMKWDNGRTLAIVPGEDSFTVLPPKLETLKLYAPLTADLYERNRYGDLENESVVLDGRSREKNCAGMNRRSRRR